MKITKNLTLIIVFLLLFSLVVSCTQAPPKNQTQDQTGNKDDDGTENPTEDKKDEELGEQDEQNKEETPPKEDAGENGEKGPTTPEGIKDGSYEGKTDKDERGNYGIAKITIKDGKITEAEYTEYTEDDKPKSKENGYEYEPTLKAMDELPEQLIEVQDVDKIDTYTGATGTTNKFKTAVMNALKEGTK